MLLGHCPSGHHIGIRAEEAFAVEVDQVVWGFGDPDFGFPGDVREETAHGVSRRERRDEDQAGGGTGEEFFQFFAALAVDWSRARHRFDQDEPVAARVEHDNVRHLRGGGDCHAELAQGFGIEMQELVLGVADVEQYGSQREAGTELFDDLLDERVLSAG